MPFWVGVLAVIGWIGIQWYWASKKEDKEKEEFEDSNQYNNEIIDKIYNTKTLATTLEADNKISNIFEIGISGFTSIFQIIIDLLNSQIAFPYYQVELIKSIPFIFFALHDYIVENSALFNNDEYYSKLLELVSSEEFFTNLDKNLEKPKFKKSSYKKFIKYLDIKDKYPDEYISHLEGFHIELEKRNMAFNEHLSSKNDRQIIIAARKDGLINEMSWIWSEIIKGTSIEQLREFYTPFLRNSDIIRFRGYPHSQGLYPKFEPRD